MDFSDFILIPIAFLGNHRVWMAFAEDVAIFNDYRSNIQNHLTNSGIPECSESLWIGIYRIGRNRDNARTVVVVSCSDYKIRKLTKEGLRNCPHFQQGGALARFRIIGKATPPETTGEPIQTMQVDDESNEFSDDSSEELDLDNQPSGHTSGEHQSGVSLSWNRSATGNDYLGKRILARQQSDQGVSKSQSATAGPLILVDGHSYQLTVQHVANFDTADDWDEEDIEDLEGSCSSGEDLAALNAPSSLPESKESPYRDAGEAVSSDSLSAHSFNRNTKLETFENLEQQSQHLYTGSTARNSRPSGPQESQETTTQGSSSLLQPGTLDEQPPLFGSPEIDYLLIPTDVESGRVPGSAEIIQECEYFNVYGIMEARPVIIATNALGYVRGAMFPAPLLSRKPRSQSFQTLFCVQSEKSIPKGASGSAVFDGETGLLAGYIVLGCPGDNIWYVTPISTVLNDLRGRLGVEASCNIHLDVTGSKESRHEGRNETKQNESFLVALRPQATEPTSRIARPLVQDGLEEHTKRGRSYRISEITSQAERIQNCLQPSRRDGFEIAIICALSLEYDAVSYIFDEFWDENGDPYGRAAGDPNNYTTGRIGKYNVVLALLPGMGKTNAASAVASMRSSYGGLRLALLIGVCGAMPCYQNVEILLGDVVISNAVVQYDLGRQFSDKFFRKDTIGDSHGRLNKDVRNLMTIFKTDQGLDRLGQRTAHFLQQLQARVDQTSRRGKYNYPGPAQDKAFEPNYRHKHHVLPTCICRNSFGDSDPVCDEATTSSCRDLGCDDEHLVTRKRILANLQTEHDNSDATFQPSVHVGVMASGDKVLRSAADRDRLSREAGVIAFEMEGNGVWDEVPCIVVKGVCDYADSHKNKDWQNFAAATAASASKAILERYIRVETG